MPSRVLVLLLALIILQSCDLPSGQAGSSASPTPTLGPDELSLCQSLGLAAPASEAGPVETIPATPLIQSTAFTGQYPYIEFVPLYPGAEIADPDTYNVTPDGGMELRLRTSADIDSVLQFYADALPHNGWVPTGIALPQSSSKAGGEAGIYIWIDPADALPWNMTLIIRVNDVTSPGSTGGRTGIYMWYSRNPEIGKNLAMYPTASTITTSCSENFIINTHVADRSYKAAIQKSYITQASPQEVTDYYSKVLTTYGWRLQSDGTYYGIVPISPRALNFVSHLQIKTTPADGGGTKVELTQSITRYLEPHLG